MNKIVNEIDVKNKRVIVRVDFNVPVKDGVITDVNKIQQSMDTINYLVKEGAKIVLLSHFGKVKNTEDFENNTLLPVYNYLKKILSTNIYFCESQNPIEIYKESRKLEFGEILLLENTRFFDVPGKLESNNDIQLSMLYASLGDIFVFEAFGSAHRNHASTTGIAKHIPSCFGLLVAKEISELTNKVLNAEHPFTMIMGGAKIDDKLSLIKSLLPKCDNLILGGGLANSFLKVNGYDIGSSLASNDPEVLKEVKEIYEQYQEKIILPIDVILGRKYDETYVNYASLDDILIDDQILDIGLKSINQIQEILNKETRTLFINGTVGKYEDMKFANGTKELLRIIGEGAYNKVAGGGDAVSAINTLGFNKSFNYLSTGGGATLKFLAEGTLVAIEAIKRGQ